LLGFSGWGQVLDSLISSFKKVSKNVCQLRGFRFTVVRDRFNDFKKLVQRQFTLVLNIKWKENSKREHHMLYCRATSGLLAFLFCTEKIEKSQKMTMHHGSPHYFMSCTLRALIVSLISSFEQF
jgi:hypothetical protein